MGESNVFNNCSFHFYKSNENVYRRVLMTIYQMRSDADTNKGNKAIIDDIFKGSKVPVVFETDELKEEILYSDNNPTRKAFQVDAKVQTANGKPIAYKVMALYDVIDIE